MAKKTKFYTAVNCNRLFHADEKEIQFEPSMLVAGVWHGTYKTDDKDIQKALKDELGVSEVTEQEWIETTQKKIIPPGEFNPLRSLSSAKAEPPNLTQVEDAGPVQSVLQKQADDAAKAAEVPEVSVDVALATGPTDRAQSKGKSKGKK